MGEVASVQWTWVTVVCDSKALAVSQWVGYRLGSGDGHLGLGVVCSVSALGLETAPAGGMSADGTALSRTLPAGSPARGQRSRGGSNSTYAHAELLTRP